MLKNVGPVSEVFTQDNIHSKFLANDDLNVLIVLLTFDCVSL